MAHPVHTSAVMINIYGTEIVMLLLESNSQHPHKEKNPENKDIINNNVQTEAWTIRNTVP